MTYLSVLPKELILELFLYFNYRDTISTCQILPNNVCESPSLWSHKINKELGYSTDFIKKYVYDTITQTLKTLLPINEKYLELKARNWQTLRQNFIKSMTCTHKVESFAKSSVCQRFN